MGQGQPRVIIWTTLVVLTYTMLHTKFQGHRLIGSREEDFLRFLPYMGMAAILVMWPELFEQLFVPPIPGGYIWNLVTIGPVVSEEKSFEIVDGRRRTTTDDGACLYYKLPRSLRLRWAKKPWGRTILDPGTTIQTRGPKGPEPLTWVNRPKVKLWFEPRTPWHGTILDPGTFIWTNLVKDHCALLYTKF